MKKSTFLVATTFFSIASFAQTIPNPGFETWVNNSESPHTYSVPQGWITSDAFNSQVQNLFGNPSYVVNTTSQVGGAHSGTSAVQMTVAVSNAGDTVAGAIISDPSVNHFINIAFGGPGAIGYPFASRPANLTGFEKFTIAGGDSAAIAVIFTKWNSLTSTRDTIVNLQFYYFHTAAAAWTAFSVPLPYLSALTPDTALIETGIYASGTAHIGTVFTVDDLAFTGVAGIDTHTNDAAVSVYPNPFNDQATLSISNVLLNHATFEMYDMLGNKVRVMNDVSGNTMTIDREGLSDGIYFYNFVNDGKVIATGKISVQ